jgi:transposase, IS30 family
MDLSAHLGYRAFQALPATMARTLTWDRGPEMTRHREFSMHTKIPVFFCDAYSPLATRRQREHCDGLLRQYFPKESRPVPAHRR